MLEPRGQRKDSRRVRLRDVVSETAFSSAQSRMGASWIFATAGFEFRLHRRQRSHGSSIGLSMATLALMGVILLARSSAKLLASDLI